MAQIFTPPPPADLPPPPPVYSEKPVRSNSPQTVSPHGKRGSTGGGYTAVGRKAVHNSTISMVTATDENIPVPPRYSNTASPRWPFADDADPSASGQPQPPDIIATPPLDAQGYSPTTPQSAVRRKPLDERSVNDNGTARRRTFSDNPQGTLQSLQVNRQPGRAVSMAFVEEGAPVENHQPLQYHHHQLADDVQMTALNKRASKLTIATTGSEGSTGSDVLHRPDYLGPPITRNSHFGASLPRPDSGFSSTSDLRGRTNSPQLAPLSHPRNGSRQSRSPDTRPLSYVDLLNVPYPQAPPSGVGNLVNDGLRTVVGNNASLLSTRKTLDMYRANVKKTTDPAIQYEFAVFMISAAQEESLETDSISDTTSTKSAGSIRNDLLKEAKVILQKLCDRSYPFAQYYLADGYASGLFNNGRPDLERSFPLFLAASKHGHAEAMYRTALCYEWGWGCRVDAAKAVQFYQHAASKNHPGAMLRLGRACLTGDMGLGKRYREGVRWLKRGSESADYQYNQAPHDLACLHETGFGADVFKDETYAAQLFTKAADLGHKDACFRLGEAYEFGQLNCPKDPALSIHFYTGAAEHGHPQAQMALCAWYMVGVEHVLEKDESEAYEWARKAALLGLPKAQYTVGYFTEMGIGCRRDPLEANVWYVRAADQGEERAKLRIAAIRAAASGTDPVAIAKKKAQMDSVNDGEKKKRFGIF